MVIVPIPSQATARILNERYWPTRVCLEETDMDDEGVVKTRTLD